MSRRAKTALLALAFAAVGCARSPAPATPGPRIPPLYQPPAEASAPTVDDVSRVRGLPPGAHVEIETLDGDAFARALHREDKATEWSAHFADLFLSTLSMASPASGAGAAAQRSYEDAVGGFYDARAKKLYLRRNASAPTTAALLAHEEEHALQDRFFGIPEFVKLGDADQMLAAKALFEGDATLTSTMLALHRRGSSYALTVAALARASEADYAKAAATASARERVPALSQATVNWPYERGATFVAQLAESGGWALVNAAMRNPPQTTEQVLHVEKYLAGERAVGIRPIEAPDGYMSVASGRMGELQTRYFLAECVLPHDAEEAARDWGGDAFLIATQGPRSALLWSTAWDDERAAARFYDALTARKRCPGGEKPPFVALHEGTRVAFVQGLDDDETRAREARKLLTLVGRALPPLAPFADVKLAVHPPMPLDFAHRGRVEQERFTDPTLGVASVLRDMKPLKDDGYELLATNGDARVGIASRWAPPSTELREALLSALVDGVRKVFPAGHAFDLGTSRVQTASGSVDTRTVRVEDKRVVRLGLLPVCEGRMTIVLVTSWTPGTVSGEPSADAWLKEVSVSDASPACEALKTLRDPNDVSPGSYGSR